MPDERSPKARTPAGGWPVVRPVPPAIAAQIAGPEVDFDDGAITGVIPAGPERAAARSHRPTNERIGRLEGKHDKLDDVVRGIDRRLANQDGQLEQLVKIGERAEARDIENAKLGLAKRKLEMPVKIITAIFVGAASVIVALKELL